MATAAPPPDTGESGVTPNPLTPSPAFSTTNLSELSDFELIDQDRDAWSSNPPDSGSDSDREFDHRSALSLSRNSSSILLDSYTSEHDNKDEEGHDHSTDAWSSMHLVNPNSSEDALNERNEFVAHRLVSHDRSFIDGFGSASGSEADERETSL